MAILILESRPAVIRKIRRELHAYHIRPTPIQADLSLSGSVIPSRGSGLLHPILVADGAGLCREIRSLRRAGCQNPILVYQDLRESERAMALIEAGADCVLELPLDGDEVAARIAQIQRRSRGIAGPEVAAGRMTIPLDWRPARIENERISLTWVENMLLRQLALNLDEPVSRDELYDLLYEGTEARPFGRIIDRHVCNIRKKIARSWPEGASHIRTLPGYGYSLGSRPGGPAAQSACNPLQKHEICEKRNRKP